MIYVAAILGGMGLVCMLYRRTFLGILIGMQLLGLGASVIFILAGVSSGAVTQAHLFGLFIALGGIAQLVVGYALSVRFFYMKKRVEMEELRTLKH